MSGNQGLRILFSQKTLQDSSAYVFVDFLSLENAISVASIEVAH